MRKRAKLAACAAAAVLACSTFPAAQVSALQYWDYPGFSVPPGMCQLEDGGMALPTMWRETSYSLYWQKYRVTVTVVGEDEFVSRQLVDDLYAVVPRNDCLRFYIRPEYVSEETEWKVISIVKKYISDLELSVPNLYVFVTGLHPLLSTYDYSDDIYELRGVNGAAIPDDIAGCILHDLAAADLITAFYPCGQTKNAYLVAHDYLTLYPETFEILHPAPEGKELFTPDWEAVGAWVAEHHPECEFIGFTRYDSEEAKRFGCYNPSNGLGNFKGKKYAVAPPATASFAEHFALAVELWQQFGISGRYGAGRSNVWEWEGQNALEQTGDLNIDGRVDISDAVLLARLAGGDSELQLLQYGINNADINADGMFTADDLNALLDMVVSQE